MNNNVFSMIPHCEKHKKSPEQDKQLIKALLTQKILLLIPNNNKEQCKITDESGNICYKCHDCGKISTKPLHNSHIGLTRSYILDYILRDFENNPKSISEYWNEFLDFHKYILIAACCAECNKKHEFDTEEEKEEELKRIVSIINITKEVKPESWIKEMKEMYPHRFKQEEDISNQDCSDQTNRNLERFKSDNLDKENLSQIIEAYEYGRQNSGKPISLKQIKLYKTYHKEIYKYISEELFVKMKNEQTRKDCIKELDKGRNMLKSSYPDKITRNKNPKYSYPHAILGVLIKYCNR